MTMNLIKVTIFRALIALVLINKSIAVAIHQTHCADDEIVLTTTTTNSPISRNVCQPPCGPSMCCSKWGFCGDTPLHCDNGGEVQINTTYNAMCQPPCGPGLCCSRWGFCGITLLHCDGSSWQTNSSYGNTCQPSCEPGFCCSKWGFCGSTPLHCAGGSGQINDTFGGTCEPPCGPGFCCSKWGFCGNTPLHCDGGGGLCQPPCGPGLCCSRWGFCGTTPLHCTGGIGQTNDTVGGICDPPCGPGFCCSKWGFCGDTPLHCAGGGGICQPPCGPGLCCSKWGFCGDTPLHCAGGETTTQPNTVSPPIDSGRCPPPCAPGFCCSKYGYCGNTPEHCDTPPEGGKNDTSITREQFDCIFDQLDPDLRDKRWQGFQEALSMVPFQPQNRDELMMFFAHVSHETDGLKTYEEYCGQSGECANDYQDSWCAPVQAEPGKQYYGRGWFQLSWPCNYNAAGEAIGVDLLKNPEKVAESDTLAAATALWFWNANNMGKPAREGNFGGTTQIINSIECGPTSNQDNRINRYQKVRKCFGLDEATDNLKC